MLGFILRRARGLYSYIDQEVLVHCKVPIPTRGFWPHFNVVSRALMTPQPNRLIRSAGLKANRHTNICYLCSNRPHLIIGLRIAIPPSSNKLGNYLRERLAFCSSVVMSCAKLVDITNPISNIVTVVHPQQQRGGAILRRPSELETYCAKRIFKISTFFSTRMIAQRED